MQLASLASVAHKLSPDWSLNYSFSYEASGPGVEGATSGVAVKFQVQARDQDGLPAASAAVLRVKFEGTLHTHTSSCMR